MSFLPQRATSFTFQPFLYSSFSSSLLLLLRVFPSRLFSSFLFLFFLFTVLSFFILSFLPPSSAQEYNKDPGEVDPSRVSRGLSCFQSSRVRLYGIGRVCREAYIYI